MRERNAGVTGRGEGRRDAGHHLVRDSCRDQDLDLFRAASKEMRIAALEPHDRLAVQGRGDHPAIDLILKHLAAAVRMAQADLLGRRGGIVEQGGIDQVVVEHQVGLGQALGRRGR